MKMDKEKVIKSINTLLLKQKLSRKRIYENLLSMQILKPNSEKLFNELLDYGIREGVITKSNLIQFRKKKGKLPEVYMTEQLIKLFDEVDRPKLAIAMWLGFFLGLRIREACDCLVSDINFNDKVLFVRNSKNTNRSRDGYGKDRVVTIPDIAISPLKKWLEIIGESSKYLIPSMQDPNKPIRTKTIHEQFRQLLNRCGLSEVETITEYRAKNHSKRKDMKRSSYKYKFHTLRGTYATYLLEKGVPLENIQRSLGHSQIDTTLIYAKIRDTKTKEFVNDAFNTPLRLVNNESMLNHRPEQKKEAITITAEEILKQRLARGEIDIISYKRLLAELIPENTMNIIVNKEIEQT